MMHTGYYLIRPTETLLKRLASCAEDIREMLSEPVLWTKNEPDSTWPAKAHHLQIKLAFLAHVRWQFPASGDPDMAHLLAEMLGNAPLTEAAFDRWWTVERFPADDSFESVIARMNLKAVQQIASPDAPSVAGWLEEVVKTKAEQEAIKT